MSSHPKAILVLICASIVIASQGKPRSLSVEDQQTIEKAVLEANTQMMEAANRLDADRFFSYILDTDKGTIIQDGRLFKTRAEALEVVRRGFQGIDKMDRRYDQTHVTVISPEAVLLTAEGSSTATLSDGRILSSHFAVSLVFVLRDGQWKVLHGHYSTPKQS